MKENRWGVVRRDGGGPHSTTRCTLKSSILYKNSEPPTTMSAAKCGRAFEIHKRIRQHTMHSAHTTDSGVRVASPVVQTYSKEQEWLLSDDENDTRRIGSWEENKTCSSPTYIRRHSLGPHIGLAFGERFVSQFIHVSQHTEWSICFRNHGGCHVGDTKSLLNWSTTCMMIEKLTHHVLLLLLVAIYPQHQHRHTLSTPLSVYPFCVCVLRSCCICYFYNIEKNHIALFEEQKVFCGTSSRSRPHKTFSKQQLWSLLLWLLPLLFVYIIHINCVCVSGKHTKLSSDPCTYAHHFHAILHISNEMHNDTAHNHHNGVGLDVHYLNEEVGRYDCRDSSVSENNLWNGTWHSIDVMRRWQSRGSKPQMVSHTFSSQCMQLSCNKVHMSLLLQWPVSVWKTYSYSMLELVWMNELNIMPLSSVGESASLSITF